MNVRFQPLDKPIAGKVRRPCPFGASWTKTLHDLERELGHIKADEVVIEIDIHRSDIRLDGWPRSTATTRTPGARLSFESAQGPLTFECATYPKWEDNIRAIALTLERLRAVERYGAVKGGEQYRGWAKLPPGSGGIQAAEFLSVEDAARYILRMEGFENPSTDDVEACCLDPDGYYKVAARKAHPDVGGNVDVMSKLNRARDFIEGAMCP